MIIAGLLLLSPHCNHRDGHIIQKSTNYSIIIVTMYKQYPILKRGGVNIVRYY